MKPQNVLFHNDSFLFADVIQHELDDSMSLICDKSVTTQNLAFLSYWYRKMCLQRHFQQLQCHNAVYKTSRWRPVVSLLHS